MKKLLITIITAVGIIVVFGYAGRQDRTEQIIYTMPNDVYCAIKSDHPNFSENQIAEFYLKNNRK